MPKKNVKKEYTALLPRCPEKMNGVLVHWLRKNEEANRVELREVALNSDWKKSETRYSITGEYKKYCVAELEPVTGRKHQLRVQMAHIDCPIVGDLKYGSLVKCKDGNIALKCTGLSFVHPVKKEPLSFKLNTISWNV